MARRARARKNISYKSKKKITYHGRTGYPRVHVSRDDRSYIMVRKKGGGVKRLYEGSKYQEEKGGDWKRLDL